MIHNNYCVDNDEFNSQYPTTDDKKIEVPVSDPRATTIHILK